MRYICGGGGRLVGGGPLLYAPVVDTVGGVVSGSVSARVSLVCTWLGQHSRRASRLTQLVSRADPRPSRPAVRSERSEPRSGGLDARGGGAMP